MVAWLSFRRTIMGKNPDDQKMPDPYFFLLLLIFDVVMVSADLIGLARLC
nr:hypothetical protein [Gluconobacter oxydans]